MDERLELLPVNREFPHLDALIHLYDSSFPDCERKPFEMILKGIDTHGMQGFALLENNEVVGLAFVILGEEAVVLDYLAVSEQKQNRSYGSWMLAQMQKLYQKPVIVEIESTLASSCSEGSMMKARRKSFYLQNGFLDCHQLISLFGVEMELLSSVRPVSYQEYEMILRSYFPKNLWKHVQSLETGPHS